MRARRAGAALAVAAATASAALLVAGWAGGTQAAALPLPSLSTTLLPAPTITVPPLTSPTLAVPTLPLPTLQPAPTLSGGLTIPSGTAPGGVSASNTLQVPVGTSGAAGSAASGGVVAGAPLSSTASVLSQLLGLLGTPPNVGVEQPSLEHFGSQVPPAVLASEAASARPRPAPSGGSPATGWLAIASSLFVACAIALRGRRGTRRWYRPAAIAAVPLAVALGAAAMVATVPRTVHATDAGVAVSTPAATSGPALATDASQPVPGAGYSLLARVASLEGTIAHQAAEVQLLGSLAHQPVSTDAQAPARGRGVSGPDAAAAQRAVAVRLETVLQQEYALFAAVAKDPTQASELVAAASTQPADVRDAVTYDVQAVQAAAAQQAVIAGAAQQAAASSPSTPTHAGGLPVLAAPLSGPITQGFGPTQLVFEPSMRIGGITYPHFHTGLDIAGPRDTPVGAAAAGVVALAGSETDGQGHLVGYGNYVVIAHSGDVVTLYGHLDRLLVTSGQVVQTGQPIGLEGSTGNSTGPHVHFEVRLGGTPVNPFDYLAVGAL